MALFEEHVPQEPSAGTLVCLPGVNSGAYLMHQAVEVMPNWRILRMNPPGVSGNALPLPFSVKAYARQVLELLNQHGVGEFVLLGHSLGGYAAQELARMAPERVKKLILVSTSRGQPDTAMDIALMQRRIGMSFWQLQQLIAKNVGEGHVPLFGPGFTVKEPVLFEMFLKLRKAHLPSQTVTLAHLSAGGMFSSMNWVRRLRMPVMVMHGNADNLVGVASGRKLAQALTNAQWLELYDVGHFPMLEYVSFWDKVRQFAEDRPIGMMIETPDNWLRKMVKGWWVRG